MNTVAYFEF